MRAEFNTTADFITGPGTAIPGEVVFSGPCRFVRELKEVPSTAPLDERLAYITVDAGIPQGPGISGGPEIYGADYSQSDIVAIPTGNVAAYEVLFVEHVTPFYGTPYWRAHVRYIPNLLVLAKEDGGFLLQENGAYILVS